MNRDILGSIKIADVPSSELPIKDEMDRARRVFKKGRMEWMGGPVYYEQDGSDNNNRNCNYAYPMGFKVDPMSHDLQVDTTEQ